MCRLAAYIGPEIFLSSLVTEPKHSIIHQSYKAKERIEPLNGDGFGVGWYAPQFCESPAQFKEVSPAWSNQNLRDIARVTKSTCIFAHVRAATVGGQLSRANCHPFAWKNYMFMHNGTVFGFEKVKRQLRNSLSDGAYSLINGNTDTEHLFALFTDQVKKFMKPTVRDLANALTRTISVVETLKRRANVTEASTMNLVLSDGQRLVATRYVSEGEESNSLYISQMGRFSCEDGLCCMEGGKKAALVVSEPLSESQHWQKVDNNHLIMVSRNKTVSTTPIDMKKL